MLRAFHRADGGVAIMRFATTDPTLIARDTAQYISDNPGAVPEDITEASVPATRRFRDCWTKNSEGGVQVGMPKARDQRIEEIRVLRNARLDQTDKELLRAQEQGRDTVGLLAKRQSLRDLPVKAAYDLASKTTPDEIAAYVPSELK